MKMRREEGGGGEEGRKREKTKDEMGEGA